MHTVLCGTFELHEAEATEHAGTVDRAAQNALPKCKSAECQELLPRRAAAQAGKSVLHLDAAGSYGSHWTSHRLDGLLAWADAQQQRQQGTAAAAAAGGGSHGGAGAGAATPDGAPPRSGSKSPTAGCFPSKRGLSQ